MSDSPKHVSIPGKMNKDQQPKMVFSYDKKKGHYTDGIDIEFYPIPQDDGDLAVETIRYGSQDAIVKMLARKFKEDLTKIGQKFMFDEDNPIFIPLRGYFASALRYALESDDPEKDEKFVKLKAIGHGLEAVYYNEVKVTAIANTISDLFFIDPSHPFLYNSTDDDRRYSFTSVNGKYGLVNYTSLIEKAVGVKKEDDDFVSKEVFNKVCEDSGLGEMMRAKWNKIYSDRLTVIFSRLAIKHMDEQEKQWSTLGTAV